jgi:3-oxoacyl-[acyl-carrier-protein] synthase II
MERRAVITGVGIVSPLGTGKEENWKKLIAGQSGIKELTRFDSADLHVTIAGEATDFKAKDFIKDPSHRCCPISSTGCRSEN